MTKRRQEQCANGRFFFRELNFMTFVLKIFYPKICFEISPVT